VHVCKREEYNYGYKIGCGVSLCETRSYFLRPFDLWLRDVWCLAWWPTQTTNQGLDTHTEALFRAVTGHVHVCTCV